MSSAMWSVYKHTAPNGKVYIGITHMKPTYRWGRDGKGYRSNKHFYKAIQKYGWDNFTHEIVASGLTQENALGMEHDLIIKYKAYEREHGYNRAIGGHHQSEESRRQIGETRKARGIKPWNTGKHWDDEMKAKFSAVRMGMRRGVKLSDEHREHIRLSKLGANNPNYGKPMDESLKQMLTGLNSKPVYQLISGEKVWYKSAKEASRATGVCSSNITRACRNERMTAGGFTWEYAEKSEAG